MILQWPVLEAHADALGREYDVARGRVRLEDYRLVLIGNHCEFTTGESYRRSMPDW